MTDLVLVAVLVFMAVLLGAASLAIVLLYRGWKSNRALITDLNAQLAAQQIAALTGGTTPLMGGDPAHPEPVRRRRHLALYIGGGVAAFYATCRDNIVSAFRAHPALAATAVATVATVSTAAALVMAPGDTSGQNTRRPTTTSADAEPGPDVQAADDEDTSAVNTDSVIAEDAAASTTDGPRALSAVPEDETTPSAVETPTLGSSPSPTGTAEQGTRPGGSGPSAVPPDPVQDAPTDEPPTAEEPAPGPSAPGTGAPEETTPPGKNDGLCLDVPRLVHLCLLSSA